MDDDPNDPNNHDDDELVRRTLQGDGDAFSLLFHRYNPFISRILYHIVRNQQDMEDLTISTWTKAWQSLERLKDGSKFKPWLTEIARNEALDYLRRKRRRGDGMSEEDEDPIDPSENIEDRVTTAIVFEDAMEATLARIGREQRKCFIYHMQGETNKAIVERLDLTEGTVKTYICNAKKILREEFRKRRDGYEYDK
jgi:RNA polymerase sigma-70 factor (ECF subfamily)